MKTLRTIVVEDERLPRLTLLKKLEAHRPQVEVVDSCEDYDQALQSILRHKPDLLLLDIQLQGRDALQLLAEVGRTQPLPMVIFTTAYNERRYLMEAIKFQAVDYLLKPIDVGELAVAIAKAVEQNGANRPVMETVGLLSFKNVNGRLFLKAENIAFARADGNYAMLTTFDGEEMVMESLAALERTLSGTFVRIDRSTIVNMQLVYKLNTKRRTCIFRSHDGALLQLDLSKKGIEVMLEQL